MKLPATSFYKGQTLVIILLGTSVALTVALAVSVRTISSLRQTSTTARAQAALAAAEAGAELGLSRINTEAACRTVSGCSGSGSISETATSYSYTAAAAGLSSDAYLLDLIRDQTQEIKLDTFIGTSVKVCWYDAGLDGNPEVDNAVELIYADGAGSLVKEAYYYNAAGGSDLTAIGFSAAPGAGSVVVSGRTVSFNHCLSSFPSTGLMSNPKVLRIKAFYGNLSAAVDPKGQILPVQAYRVESTGQTTDGLVVKKVRVTKSLPALPGIFDFGLYSGSATQPLSK